MNETEKRAFAALNAYYTSHDEDARFDSRHNSVEFLTTLDYIGRYLSPGDRIAEIGAGSGRYSHALARQGYHVDAVELIPRNIALFRERTEPGEEVVIREGTATDLSCFADGMFGMTLLLGPMYHLFTEEEQRQALREAVRITKPGGHVFVSYCMNEGTVVRFGFLGHNILPCLAAGKIDPVSFRCYSDPEDLFVLWRREAIFALTEDLPVRRLHFVGTDMFTNYFREAVDAMSEEEFDAWLAYHRAICEREDLVGLTFHALDILEKEEET